MQSNVPRWWRTNLWKNAKVRIVRHRNKNWHVTSCVTVGVVIKANDSTFTFLVIRKHQPFERNRSKICLHGFTNTFLQLFLRVNIVNFDKHFFSLNCPFSITQILKIMLSPNVHDSCSASWRPINLLAKIVFHGLIIIIFHSNNHDDIWRFFHFVIHEKFIHDIHGCHIHKFT